MPKLIHLTQLTGSLTMRGDMAAQFEDHPIWGPYPEDDDHPFIDGHGLMFKRWVWNGVAYYRPDDIDFTEKWVLKRMPQDRQIILLRALGHMQENPNLLFYHS